MHFIRSPHNTELWLSASKEERQRFHTVSAHRFRYE
nr:MAG TPA: protein of unknown function (DUF2057) [Caudoviricetes sp.]